MCAGTPQQATAIEGGTGGNKRGNALEQDCWLGRNNKGSKPQGNMYKHTRAKLEDNEREREGGCKEWELRERQQEESERYVEREIEREKGKSLHSTLQSQHQSGDYINTASSEHQKATNQRRGKEERQRGETENFIVSLFVTVQLLHLVKVCEREWSQSKSCINNQYTHIHTNTMKSQSVLLHYKNVLMEKLATTKGSILTPAGIKTQPNICAEWHSTHNTYYKNAAIKGIKGDERSKKSQ